jgi:hypothetical protein
VPVPGTAIGNLYGYDGCHDLTRKTIAYFSLLLSAVSFCTLQNFSIISYSKMGKINRKNIFFVSEINADRNSGGTHICKWGIWNMNIILGYSFSLDKSKAVSINRKLMVADLVKKIRSFSRT